MVYLRAVGLTLGVLLGVAWTSTTAQRVRVFSDEAALWLDAAAQAPQKPRAWINLGKQFHLEGREAEAFQFYARGREAALNRQRPQTEQIVSAALAESNIALLHAERREYHEARIYSQAARTRAPHNQSVRKVDEWIRTLPDSP